MRAAACGPSTTPTGRGSGGRLLNARLRIAASRIGNTNTQNTASGSRVSSRIRASVSSASALRTLYWRGALAIAQPSAGQRHEHILKCRVVRGQMRRLEPVLREHCKQRRHGAVHLADRDAPYPVLARDVLHARQRAHLVVAHRTVAADGKLDDVLGAE